MNSTFIVLSGQLHLTVSILSTQHFLHCQLHRIMLNINKVPFEAHPCTMCIAHFINIYIFQSWNIHDVRIKYARVCHLVERYRSENIIFIILDVIVSINKMSFGRPEEKETKDLEALFTEFEEQIVQDGRVIPPRSEIWSHIRTKYSIDKKNKAIYTAATRWLKKTQKPAECEIENQTHTENDVSIETSMECIQINPLRMKSSVHRKIKG